MLCLCAAGSSAEFSSLREALPAYAPGSEVIEHTGYTLLYCEPREQASWVAYVLTVERLAGMARRSGNFRADKSVLTGSATPEDYSRTGYDRGHLAPAADMKWSTRAMSESFLMSNMSPMAPEFNRGIWEHLESRVREWAGENGELYIVVGPVFADSTQVIGKDGVAVPRAFFKVILDYRQPDYKGIGFIMPNEASSLSIDTYAVTIDSVEKATGIDFFPALPDTLELSIEGSLLPASWGLSGREIAAIREAASTSGSQTVRKGLPVKTIAIALIVLFAVALIIWLVLMALLKALGFFVKGKK
jgi:endonuclease G, mitochondrial